MYVCIDVYAYTFKYMYISWKSTRRRRRLVSGERVQIFGPWEDAGHPELNFLALALSGHSDVGGTSATEHSLAPPRCMCVYLHISVHMHMHIFTFMFSFMFMLAFLHGHLSLSMYMYTYMLHPTMYEKEGVGAYSTSQLLFPKLVGGCRSCHDSRQLRLLVITGSGISLLLAPGHMSLQSILWILGPCLGWT